MCGYDTQPPGIKQFNAGNSKSTMKIAELLMKKPSFLGIGIAVFDEFYGSPNHNGKRDERIRDPEDN